MKLTVSVGRLQLEGDAYLTNQKKFKLSYRTAGPWVFVILDFESDL